MDNRIEYIRKRLKEFISFHDGEKLRNELKVIASRTYKPKYQKEHMKYMNEHECKFEENHPQSKNHPFVWSMFSIPSQHVLGDSVEECLDKAIEMANNIRDYKRKARNKRKRHR